MGLHALITRTEPRRIDQRSEERQSGVVERAIIRFRGGEHLVRVVDISSRGTRIECDLRPMIGETIVIQFEHCSRVNAFVRWLREGQIGLNFGHEIVLAV